MFNIKSIAVAETGVFHIKDAEGNLQYTDDKRPRTITFHTPASKIYADAQAKQRNSAIDLLKKSGKTDQTSDQSLEVTATFLAAITISFDDWVYIPDGAPEPLTGKAQFKAAFSDRSIGFLTEAFQIYAAEWGNASKASSPS